MRALITGATGFIGTYLTKRLIADGDNVRIVMREDKLPADFAGLALDVRQGDVTNAESLVSACRDIDVVFHLAGLIAHSRSEREHMRQINVEGTRNVVQACTACGVRKLVHLSSISAVGASFDGLIPLTEKSPYNVASLRLAYFDTKQEGEAIALAAAREGTLDVVALNPGTIYGAGDARKGSRGTQLKVAQGKMPFYTSGGVNVMAVEDTIDALIAARDRGRSGERYLIGGENLLLRDVFAMIADAAGVARPRLYLPNFAVRALGEIGDWRERKTNGVKHGPLTSENAWGAILFHWLDDAKARRELKLAPAQSARSAIESSVRWMRDHGLIGSSPRAD